MCLLHCIALIDSLLTHYKTHLTKWQSKKRRAVTMLVRLTMLMVTIVDHLDHQVGAQAELQQGRNSQWEHWSWPSRGQQLKVRIHCHLHLSSSSSYPYSSSIMMIIGWRELKVGILLQLIIAIMVVTLLRHPFSSLL